MPAFYLADKYITMNKKNLEQALAALSDALTSQEPNELPINPLVFVEKLPKRSLSGDHINGGKILHFSSAGIKDSATTEQLVVTDDGIVVKSIKADNVVGDINVSETLTAKTIKVDVLEAKEIKADIKFEKNENIEFTGYGKGLIWTGSGYTKQIVFQSNPDRFFVSEDLDLQKNKHYAVGGIKVLDDKELGSTIVKSNLREVGRLRGLIVDGSVNINQYLFYNGASDRLGIGTEDPHAAFSVAEDAIEVMLGTKDSVKGMVGTYASHDLEIVTDNTARVSISSNGNIQLGNKNFTPIQVSIHGNLAVNVSSPDPRANLHISGALKFNDTLHLKGNMPPQDGSFKQGDIVWNSEPQQRQFVGWVCIKSGTPGIWASFGEIR